MSKIKWNSLVINPTFDVNQDRLIIIQDGRGQIHTLCCDEFIDFDNTITRLKSQAEEMDLPITWVDIGALQSQIDRLTATNATLQSEVNGLRGELKVIFTLASKLVDDGVSSYGQVRIKEIAESAIKEQ